mmetsp:Transcript_10624/g.44076  ORF Transcript_10624/g.44076 Transcript_10624/m.44076 type:complete len:339 (-) Transcript_10624:2159-3175(-)
MNRLCKKFTRTPSLAHAHEHVLEGRLRHRVILQHSLRPAPFQRVERPGEDLRVREPNLQPPRVRLGDSRAAAAARRLERGSHRRGFPRALLPAPVRGGRHLGVHDVPLAEPSLQVLRRSEAPQPSSRHHAHALAERLALVHGVGGQQHRETLRGALHGVPHHAPSERAHPAAGLVQEEHARAADERHREREFPLVAAAVGSARSVGKLGEADAAKNRGGGGVHVPRGDALERGVHARGFASGHQLQERVELGAVSQHPLHSSQVGGDVVAANRHRPRCGGVIAAEHLQGRALPRAVHAEQPEAFAATDAKAQAVHGDACLRATPRRARRTQRQRRRPG